MQDVEVIPLSSLGALIGHLTGLKPLEPFSVGPEEAFCQEPVYAVDFADIMGYMHLKRVD